MQYFGPPNNEKDLLNRSRLLAGRSIKELARLLDTKVPKNISYAKGWVGTLLEELLGATGSSKPVLDFENLGIEMKTIPVFEGRPCESTYVCTVPLNTLNNCIWENSWVKKKLSKVLWVPIESCPDISLPNRKVGMPMLWQMDEYYNDILKNDWQELMDIIALGKFNNISANIGTYLHIRPKAANAKSICRGVDNNGNNVNTLPRGFYLRTHFTERLLKECYG